MDKKVRWDKVLFTIAIILCIIAIVFLILNAGFDETPRAYGAYGTRVVRPKSPYRLWLWVFAALSCITCSIAECFSQNEGNSERTKQ